MYFLVQSDIDIADPVRQPAEAARRFRQLPAVVQGRQHPNPRRPCRRVAWLETMGSRPSKPRPVNSTTVRLARSRPVMVQRSFRALA
jgi:hypothetical protein